MELVPILSTIILVGTIATFILAVAAYILYKIRERRAREESRPAMYAQPEPHVLVAPQVSASLQAPAEAAMYAPSRAQHALGAPSMQQQQPQRSQNSLFWEYTDEGFVPVNPQEEQASREPVRQQAPQQQQAQDEGYAWL